jgi:cytochrome b involved in lipid metabolism
LKAVRIIKEYKDATADFLDIHHSKEAELIMEQYLIGYLE